MPPEQSTSAANQALAGAVRAAREQSGYTPESFAAHAALDQSTYAAIERGELELTLDTVVQIAVALDSSAAELFRRAEL